MALRTYQEQITPEGMFMANYPHSLREFQSRFSDDAACAAYLAAKRWPDGFRCPHCGETKSWRLPSRKVPTFLCGQCRKETSVTAGTVMHGSHLPLAVWFWAAFLMATHSNGISALQLQSELGLGSYKTAWLLGMKLRLAMVAPERSPLSGLVEADETSIPFRTKDDPPAGGQGRCHDGKLLVAGAVEIRSGKKGRPVLGRARLCVIADFCASTLHAFMKNNIASGTVAKTDGFASYAGMPHVNHEPHVIGPMAAHIVLPGMLLSIPCLALRQAKNPPPTTC
jgi:predicted RNA-binding Zn-ribbon protein involved in translation (DUF1610 family)